MGEAANHVKKSAKTTQENRYLVRRWLKTSQRLSAIARLSQPPQGFIPR
jgi:hypothetical protein